MGEIQSVTKAEFRESLEMLAKHRVYLYKLACFCREANDTPAREEIESAIVKLIEYQKETRGGVDFSAIRDGFKDQDIPDRILMAAAWDENCIGEIAKMQISEALALRVIEVCEGMKERNKEFAERILGSLSENPGISDNVRKKLIEVARENDLFPSMLSFRIWEIFMREDAPEDLIRAGISVCEERGWIDILGGLVAKREKLSDGINAALESALINGVRVSAEHHHVQDICRLFEGKEFSEEVVNAAIESCGKAGLLMKARFEPLAECEQLLRPRANSERLKQVFEKAVLDSARYHARRGDDRYLVRIIEETEDISAATRKKAERSLLRAVTSRETTNCGDDLVWLFRGAAKQEALRPIITRDITALGRKGDCVRLEKYLRVEYLLEARVRRTLNAALLRAIKVCEERLDSQLIDGLLKEKLPESVRKAAEAASGRTSPEEKVQGYIEQVKDQDIQGLQKPSAPKRAPTPMRQADSRKKQRARG